MFVPLREKIRSSTFIVCLIGMLFSLPVFAENRILSSTPFDTYSFCLEEIYTPSKKVHSAQYDLFLRAYDIKSNKKIDELRLSHEHYGGRVYGQAVPLKVIHSGKMLYIILNTSFGGDGDHSEPRSFVISFVNTKLKISYNLNMGDITYSSPDNDSFMITGNGLICLNPYGDGPEIGDPQDIFFIPIKVMIQGGAVSATCALSDDERSAMRQRFNERKMDYLKQDHVKEDENFKKWIEKKSNEFTSIIDQK